MSKSLRKDILILLIYILSSTIIEITTFYFLGFGSSPKYIGFNLAFLIGSAMFMFLLPNLFKIIVSSIILLLQITLSVVNSTLYYTNGDIFFLETIKQSEAGMQVISSDVFDIPYIIIVILIFIVTLVAFILVLRFMKIEKEEKVNRKILPLVFIMAFSGPVGLSIQDITYNCLNTNTIDLMSNWQGVSLTNGITEEDINNTIQEVSNEQYLYDNLNLGIPALKNYGTFGFYLKNLNNLLSYKDTSKKDEKIQKTIDYINAGEFVNARIDTSNGNNVITVLLESCAWYMLDPYLTPNLYALSNTSDNEFVNNEDLKYIANNSIKLTNYYGRNTTNISEKLMLLGNYPSSKDAYYTLNSKDCSDLKFNYSLANTLKDKNETVLTKFFHAGDENIYFRRYNMEAIGFDETHLLQDMGCVEGYDFKNFYDFVLDSDLISALGDKMFTTDGRFYTHISTMTTHGTYLNKHESNKRRLQPYTDLLLENWDKVYNYNITTMPELNFPEKNQGDFYIEYVNYKSAMMDLDKAVGILFDQLKERNLLDNTTICLFADHYSYYNDFALQVYGYKHNDIGHSEIYHIPAFIYDTKASKKITNNYADKDMLFYDNFCDPSSLLPSMLDILGIDYNSNYYLGYSIFDENILNYVQVASLSGFITDNFFSFNIFDIEDTKVADRIDFNNLRQRYYCNAVYAYSKIKYLDNLYIYNNQIFK